MWEFENKIIQVHELYNSNVYTRNGFSNTTFKIARLTCTILLCNVLQNWNYEVRSFLSEMKL